MCELYTRRPFTSLQNTFCEPEEDGWLYPILRPPYNAGIAHD